MLETISRTEPSQTPAPLQRGDGTLSSQEGTSMTSAPEATPTEKSADILPFSDQMAHAQKKVEEDRQAQQDQKRVTEEMLAELERDIETMHSIDLQFSQFDKSGKTYVKIIDRSNDKVIREIPSEEALMLAAKMDELIGILFDKQA